MNRKDEPVRCGESRFLLQFNQPLLYILLIAGAIKAILGQWVNAWVIWGVAMGVKVVETALFPQVD